MFLVESHDDSINSADDSSWWLDTGPEHFMFLAPCFILFISKPENPTDSLLLLLQNNGPREH